MSRSPTLSLFDTVVYQRIGQAMKAREARKTQAKAPSHVEDGLPSGLSAARRVNKSPMLLQVLSRLIFPRTPIGV